MERELNIVILDGYTANPGDLCWSELEALGNVTVYDRTAPAQLVERSINADILLTNKTVIDEEAIRVLPKLKYIGVLATGYNVVDINAAHDAGISVTNIPAYSTDSVAQQVFALLLSITNHAEYYAEQNRLGRWARSKDFSYTDFPLIELAGKKMGIVGYGHIGSAVARIARAFGMQVYVSSSKPQSALTDVIKMDLDEIFRTCDVVSLHCPLTDETRNMVNATRLAMMKPNAILINTGRGPLVDEEALAKALDKGNLYAAGVDVLRQEPPTADNPLTRNRHCYVTPHVAWASKEARGRLLEIATANIKAFIEGNPMNLV